MPGSLAEILKHFAVEDDQVDQRRVAVIEIRARQLAEVGREHLLFSSSLVGVHARNRSEVNMRVDKTRNEELAFAGDDGSSCGRPRRGGVVNAENPAVFNNDGSNGWMSQIFRRNDRDASDPRLSGGFALGLCHLSEGKEGYEECRSH